MQIVAFVPCRAGSQRVPNKNTRPFAGEADGLTGIKLRQLQACGTIDRIVLSTNDTRVTEIAMHYMQGAKPLEIIQRPEHLCLSSTSTDELITYVPSIIPDAVVLWTHVTSPMVGPAEYAAIIDAYRQGMDSGYDSLMSVTELRSFVWNASGPINYDRAKEKWPRTQTIEPLFVVNSAVFMVDTALMRRLNDRIGERPLLYPMGERISYEIDWEEQFLMAERIYAQAAT